MSCQEFREDRRKKRQVTNPETGSLYDLRQCQLLTAMRFSNLLKGGLKDELRMNQKLKEY